VICKFVTPNDLVDPEYLNTARSAWAPPDEDDWSDQSQIPLTYHPVPDIA